MLEGEKGGMADDSVFQLDKWVDLVLPEPGMAGRRSSYVWGMAERTEQFYSGHLTPEMPSANTRGLDLPSRLNRRGGFKLTG